MNIEELELIALNGDRELQYQIGLLYQFGEDVKRDYDKAFKYFKMAAENGNPDAQCELGRIYCTGEGVEQDYKEGFKWFKLASNQNNELAHGNIAFMYEKGYGVNQDYKQAFRYYMMAAEHGNILAQKTISNMYAKGLGIEKNVEEANRWFKIAYEQEKVGYEQSYNVLQDEVYDEILIRCKKGDELVELGQYDDAIQFYFEALELVPYPKENWEASTWIYTALGDTYFQIKKYTESKNYLFEALNCPKGISNPFILLRLGQCFYKLNNMERAKEYLLKSYMVEGFEIFENEENKYFELIKSII